MKSPICVLKFVFINVYIIVSDKTVHEGGSGVIPQKKIVIFIQNGASLDNTNGYKCLDIMPQ